MIKLRTDLEADALYLRISDAEIIESEEVKPDVILDFDEAQNVVGLEILNLSKHVTIGNVPKVNFEAA